MEKNDIVFWTTKTGEKINVDEMSIEHLRNVVKMIVRQREHAESVANAFNGFFTENQYNVY